MRFLSSFVVACTAIWPAGVLCKRNLPAKLQVDLLFPQNETYNPLPLFPVVLAFKGLEDIWPLPMSLDIVVYKRDSSGASSPEGRQNFFVNTANFVDRVNSTLNKEHLLFVPVANITNSTTAQWGVAYRLNVFRRCAANGTEIERGWTTGDITGTSNYVNFSTAPNGKVPDIEASVKACPTSVPKSSVAIGITDIVTNHIYDSELVSYRDECAVFDAVDADLCPHKNVAAQVATNVSGTMLSEWHCSEGAWQTISQECPRKNIAASLLDPTCIRTSVFWSVALALINITI